MQRRDGVREKRFVEEKRRKRGRKEESRKKKNGWKKKREGREVTEHKSEREKQR